MELEILENNKKINLRQYEYEQSILNENGEVVEFLYLVKGDDYSFTYYNFSDEYKHGQFLIEKDSIIYDAFRRLVGNDKEFKITDDYSERVITFKKDKTENIMILFELLENEYDGTIELKNIMLDFRSQVDREGSNTKERLSNLFDDLLIILEKQKTKIKQKKLL